MWTPTKTVVEIHSAFMAYYEAYDRSVSLTAGIVDVTLMVPAQDWATRFTEMQSHFQSWVTTLIIDYPGRSTTQQLSMRTWRVAGLPSLLRSLASRPVARLATEDVFFSSPMRP